MSVAVLVKRRLAPLAKTVAPGLVLAAQVERLGESNPEVQLVRSLCDPDRVSLDMGAAAAGEFTIAMLAASRLVIAIEPQPTQTRALAAMFDAVGSTVRVEAVALSDRPGVTKMRVLESDPGRSTIDSDNALNDADGSRVGTIEVQVRWLDDLQLDDVGSRSTSRATNSPCCVALPTRSCATGRRFFIEAEERHHRHAAAATTEFLAGLDYKGVPLCLSRGLRGLIVTFVLVALFVGDHGAPELVG